MGNWRLDITGKGPGLNARNLRDVDKLASEFLRVLVDAGHVDVKGTVSVDNAGGQLGIAPSEAQRAALDASKKAGEV